MKTLLAALLALGAGHAWSAEQPWNVVVVDICSARADHWGMYGYRRPTTPRMDALAKESAVFDRAVAQSSWCLPNYSSLFTGHVPEVHGQYANLPFRPMPAFEHPIAERLKDAGYATAAFSGGVYFLPAWGLGRGFETYENRFSTPEARPGQFQEYLPNISRWLQQNKSGPFFLYAAVDDLHAPYQSDNPERFDPGYQGIVHDTDVIHVRFFRAYDGEQDDALKPKLLAFRSDPRNMTHLIAHYDSALTQVDRGVGDLVDRLKKMGLWDKTVLIVTADHGELLGEKGLLGHTQGLYEPIVHVPLLIHHPAFPASAGKHLGQLVERVDLAPTVLQTARVDAPDAELQGESLLPLLADPARPGRALAFASSKRNMSKISDLDIDERVVRDRRWKLHWYLYKEHFELYDLQSDPLEKDDVAAKHPDIVQRLSFELLRNVEKTRPHAPGLPSGRQGPGDARLSTEQAPRD